MPDETEKLYFDQEIVERKTHNFLHDGHREGSAEYLLVMKPRLLQVSVYWLFDDTTTKGTMGLLHASFQPDGAFPYLRDDGIVRLAGLICDAMESGKLLQASRKDTFTFLINAAHILTHNKHHFVAAMPNLKLAQRFLDYAILQEVK